MDLRKQIFTKNECYKRGVKMVPKGIMWHSTGANNPKLSRYVGPDDGKLGVNKYDNHWNQLRPGGKQVCVHAFVGKDKNGKVCTYQTLPFNIKGWHAGGSANNNYIGFEICEDDLKDKTYFNNVYKEAVEFTAHLCKLYGLNPMSKNVIICHQDGYKLGIASNHGDVYTWFKKYSKTMDDVRKDVEKAMNPTFKVRVEVSNLSIRKGAGLTYGKNGVCPKGTYTITKTKKADGITWGHLKSDAGWINLNKVKRL